MNKNHWGEPDDMEPLPDWMSAKTYQNGNQLKKSRQSLEEVCAVVLTKPAVYVTITEPIDQ